MRPGPKLAAFALALAASVGLGAALGRAVGPIDTGDEGPHTTTTFVEAPSPHDGGALSHP